MTNQSRRSGNAVQSAYLQWTTVRNNNYPAMAKIIIIILIANSHQFGFELSYDKETGNISMSFFPLFTKTGLLDSWNPDLLDTFAKVIMFFNYLMPHSHQQNMFS